MSDTPKSPGAQNSSPSQQPRSPVVSLFQIVKSSFKQNDDQVSQTSTLFQKRDQFPTGINTVDSALNGGVHGITFLAGRPGVGKTAFLSQVAVKAVQNRRDNVVLIYSLDMSTKEFAQRLLIAATAQAEPDINGAPNEDMVSNFSSGAMTRIFVNNQFRHMVMRKLTKEEKKIYLSTGQLKVAGITYPRELLKQFRPGEDWTVSNTRFPHVKSFTNSFSGSALQEVGEWLADGKGYKNLLVMIDLFQDIRCDQNSGNRRDDQILEHFKENELRLKRLFPGGNVSFLISSAVRKESNAKDNQARSIRLDDVIGSTNLAYSADVVLGLNFKKKLNEDTNAVVLDVLKGRDGVTRGAIDLSYQFKTGQFSSVAQDTSQRKKKAAKKRRPDLEK